MGNRAVITSSLDLKDNTTELSERSDKIGLYLHWNGGFDSVHGFLTYCKMIGARAPTEDEAYAFAQLTRVITNFFGGTLSVGVGTLNHLDCDNFDNGVYIVGDNWEIVGRKYIEGEEQDSYNLKEMLIEIDERQPKSQQLGKEEIEKLLTEGAKNV